MTIVDQLAPVPKEFSDFLDSRGLVYDPLTQVDMLASVLGSQLLLFAGPSGTGKSTAAKALADFFVPSNRSGVIDVRPSWTSSEDVVGQYSVFTSAYIKGPATDLLLSLDQGTTPAVLIVEEANLSPMEAYLGPVISAASSVSFGYLSWPLHSAGAATGTQEQVELWPWPRVFGTVNVDSTATAPAPKVSGRACVVLLEPSEIDTALSSTSALNAAPSGTVVPPGAALLQDPSTAWATYLMSGTTAQFTEALKVLLEVLAGSAGRGMNVVSPRDVQRCVLYMSWHFPLMEAAAQAHLVSAPSLAESAENAILHFVLPGLSAEQFGRAVVPLAGAATPDGLLHRRLGKLVAGGESLFGISPDFWASLS